MEIVPGKTFRIGDSEALCLPNDMAFGIGTEVEIVREGDGIVIRRRAKFTGEDLANALHALPKPDRRLSREAIEWPDRTGTQRR